MIMYAANYLQNKYKIRKLSKRYNKNKKNVQEIKILFQEQNNKEKSCYIVGKVNGRYMEDLEYCNLDYSSDCIDNKILNSGFPQTFLSHIIKIISVQLHWCQITGIQ